MAMTKNTPSKNNSNSLCMSLERVVGTQIRFLFMAIWARFWVVHSGWRRRCVRWSGFLGLRGLGLSISVGLLSVRVNKSNMLSFLLKKPQGLWWTQWGLKIWVHQSIWAFFCTHVFWWTQKPWKSSRVHQTTWGFGSTKTNDFFFE